MVDTKEALEVVATHFNVDSSKVVELLTAFNEGRVKVVSKYTDKRCESCQNFNPEQGKASGPCSARISRHQNEPGLIKPLWVCRSHKACLDYVPKPVDSK